MPVHVIPYNAADIDRHHNGDESSRPVTNKLNGNQNWNVPGADGSLTSSPQTFTVGQEFSSGRFVIGADLVNVQVVNGIFSAFSGSYYVEYSGGDFTSDFFGVKIADNTIVETGVSIAFIGGNTRLTVDVTVAPDHKSIGLASQKGVWNDINDAQSSSFNTNYSGNEFGKDRQAAVSGSVGSRQLDITAGIFGQDATGIDRIYFDDLTDKKYFYLDDLNPSGVVTNVVDNTDGSLALITTTGSFNFISSARLGGGVNAFDYIADYLNPTAAEITRLMTIGKPVYWRAATLNQPNVTIDFSDGTYWHGMYRGAVKFLAGFSANMLYTVTVDASCGYTNIDFDGNGIADSIVRFSNCKHVTCKGSTASNINPLNSTQYSGGFIFNTCEMVDYDDLHCENIQQTLTSLHQFQSYNFVDCGLNGGVCTAKNVDKVFGIGGLVTGNAGMFKSEDSLDNVCYVLGTPRGLKASFYGVNYKQGIVYNAEAGSRSSMRIDFADFENGSSRVVVLRSGEGLSVGELTAVDCLSGISDTSYDGVTNCTFESIRLENITTGRPLELVEGSVVDIGSFTDVNSSATDFSECLRIQGESRLRVGKFETYVGTATTAVRVQELTTGNLYIDELITDKANKVVYEAGVEFGGKSFVNRINGFLIQGGAPSTLVLAAGALTVLQNSHRIDTEGGAASDDLDNIFGAPSIDTIITLQTTSNLRDVTLKHGTGNIYLPSATDVTLNATNDTVQLKWNGSVWTKPL